MDPVRFEYPVNQDSGPKGCSMLMDTVQSHCALLLVDELGRIIGYSENIAENFGVRVSLGDYAPNVISGIMHFSNVLNNVLDYDDLRSIPSGDGKKMACSIWKDYNRAIVRCMVYEKRYSVVNINCPLNDVDSEDGAIYRVFDLLVRTGGFDRVIMYKFNKLFDGKVTHETKGTGVKSILGLTRPARDIPEHVRKGILRNGFRIICDANDPCSRITTIPGIDIQRYTESCPFRGVNPHHSKYLKTMGLSSSCSFPVVVSGVYWGLVICHSVSPNYPSLGILKDMQLLVNGLGAWLSVRKVKEFEEFMGVLCHEIRTPLNGIVAMSSLYDDMMTDMTRRECIDIVKLSAKYLLSLVNDVLDFQKLEQGRITLNVAECDLRDLVDDVIDLAGMTLSKKIELVQIYKTGTPRFVQCDSARIKQVLLNLVSNAIKFTRNGTVMVTTSATVCSDSFSEFVFAVKDTGIGISPEDMDRIFYKFEQVSNPVTSKQKGTGMGLFITKRLVELMGGKIQVESEPSKGSNFMVTLRLQVCHEVDYLPRERIRSHLSDSSIRVLVLSANQWTFLNVNNYLDDVGIGVTVSKSTEEAKTLLEHAISLGRPYSLLLCDYDVFLGADGSLCSSIEDFQGQLSQLKIDMRVVLMIMSHDSYGLSSSTVSPWTLVTKPLRRSFLMNLLMEIADETGPSQPRGLPSPSSATDIAVTSNIKILVVDDNAVNLKVASRILESLGYFCDVAASGEDALNKGKTVKYDVIFMDIQMPEMDGFECCRRFRHLYSDHRPHIVALTAGTIQEFVEHSYESGMDDFMMKPIVKDKFRDILANLKIGEGRSFEPWKFENENGVR